MKAAVVSDVHLGSRYFLHDLFLQFLSSLPPDVDLVLNGDTIDIIHKSLPPAHEEVLDRLRAESLRRRVIWVHGNHDEDYRMENPGRIEFAPSYSIGKRLFVAHGYDFDNVMPYHRTFVKLFRAIHRLRVKLGAEAVHVAQYAKRWKILYNVLLKNVVMNAVEHAKENGYEAVACGHTHYAQDIEVKGIRYLNTGAWTERPVYYLMADDTSLRLVEFRGL